MPRLMRVLMEDTAVIRENNVVILLLRCYSFFPTLKTENQGWESHNVPVKTESSKIIVKVKDTIEMLKTKLIQFSHTLAFYILLHDPWQSQTVCGFLLTALPPSKKKVVKHM